MSDLSPSLSEVVIGQNDEQTSRLQPTNTAQALAEHRCEYCIRYPSGDIARVELGAEHECLLCRLALVCANWAASTMTELDCVLSVNVLADGNTRVTFRHKNGRVMCAYYECLSLDVRTGKVVSLYMEKECKVLSDGTSSDSTFATIHEWIMECLSNHIHCARPLSDSLREFSHGIRFLEVRESSVRLCENVQPGRYACLSHCWGSGKNIIKTTGEKYKEHAEQGIEFDVLPRTFQDAVRICQKLGIRYIWIDSVCIVQDSQSDWAYQASRMADVYENAFVTIAATASPGPARGCFRPTHWTYRGEVLPGYTDVHVRRVARFSDDSGIKQTWPLFERGWAFQELNLSPRVIHFVAQEVFWQCRCMVARESKPRLDLRSCKWEFPRVFVDEGEWSLSEQWHQVVAAFTKRSLTFQKDRLPAIAAMAKQMQNFGFRGRYLAGLWENTLPLDLLWYIPSHEHAGTCQRLDTTTHRVPTWSWAYVQEAVTWPSNADINPKWMEISKSVEILDVEFKVEGPVMSGNIQQACIKIKVPLIKWSALRLLSDLRSSWVDEAYTEAIGTENMAPESAMLDMVLQFCRWDHSKEGNDFNFSHDDADVFALPLGVPMGYFPCSKQWALVVQRVGKESEFRRLGVAGMQLVGDYVLCRSGYAGYEVVWYRDRMIGMLQGMEKHEVVLV